MFVLDSNAKGDIAELAIELAATRLGVCVWRPTTAHGRTDLAFEIDGRLWRVQCKWGRLSDKRDCVIAKVGGSSARRSGYRLSTYSVEEVDLFAIYCGELDRAYLLPAELATDRHYIYLRLEPAQNSQRACVHLAANFEFPGAIAQLGERRAGSAKVAGSSPASSTSTGCTPTTVGCNPFRDAFGEWIDRVASGEEVIVTRRGKPLLRLSPAT
jgi:prevent-host-death family protein